MFATCLNCMDGRVQLPVINWIMENYNVKYIDMITEAGMNGFLADKDSNINNILKKVEISIDLHESENIFIIGHYDCAGNPVDDITHKKQINTAVDRIKDIFHELNVVGLWINDKFLVEKINDI
jgi:carbonic anhydrase